MKIRSRARYVIHSSLVILLLAVGCKQRDGAVIANDGAYPTVDTLAYALALPGTDVAATDSLIQELIPIFLSPPEFRHLEDWYAIEAGWSTRYGDAESLLYCAELAYNKFLKEGDHQSAAKIKNAVGRIHDHNGDQLKSIEAQQLAFELAQKAGDSIMVGWALFHQGGPYGRVGDSDTAIEYLERARQIGLNTGYAPLLAYSLVNIGTLYGMQGKFETSIIKLQEGLDFAIAAGQQEIEAIAQLNISYLYTALGQYEKTIEILLPSVSGETLPDGITNIFLYLNLYEAYLGQGAYQEAEKYLSLGCDMAYKMDFAYGIIHCAEFRANLEEYQGEYAQALEAYKEYHGVWEEQAGMEKARALQSLLTRSRLREKDLEIEQLAIARERSETDFQRKITGILLAITALLLMIGIIYFLIRIRHQAKIAEQQQTIAEARLKVLQSQMNPHFTFNAVGGIQNYILKSKTIDAYNYLGKFASLLRITANYSNNVYIGLEKEIEFIQTYLDLEKLRFRDDFIYRLTVDEALDQKDLNVPSMMIQPIVENAIIHGITGLDRQGELTVEFKTCNNGLQCIVSDNGRGRRAAMEISQRNGAEQHLSIASMNTERRLSFLRKLGYENAKVEIEDLYDNDTATGTRVEIYLPFMDREMFS